MGLSGTSGTVLALSSQARSKSSLLQLRTYFLKNTNYFFIDNKKPYWSSVASPVRHFLGQSQASPLFQWDILVWLSKEITMWASKTHTSLDSKGILLLLSQCSPAPAKTLLKRWHRVLLVYFARHHTVRLSSNLSSQLEDQWTILRKRDLSQRLWKYFEAELRVNPA